MTSRTFYLHDAQQGYQVLLRAWTFCKAMLMAGHGLRLTVREAKRTTDQNARMWAMLTDIAKQVEWHGRMLSTEDWKHVFTSSLRKLEVVPNLEGTGFVALGMSTSSMSKRELSDLMELMSAFASDRGVKWSEYVDPETGEIVRDV